MLSSGAFHSFYLPRDSWLHRIHVIPKAVAAAIYVLLGFAAGSPLTLLLLSLWMVIITLLLRLPVQNKFLVLVSVLLLGAVTWLSPGVGIISGLIIGLGRLSILSMSVSLFTMTTQPSQIWKSLPTSYSRLPGVNSAVFLLSTMLMAVPSIQYELQRALDAESLRRGKRLRPYSLGSWVNVLTIVLVRSLNRADRIAITMADRGLILSDWGMSGWHPLQAGDILLGLAGIVPGILLVVLVG